eukprot:scaffold8530_cov121-Isochrysis_galbana.AAC.2
MQRKKSRLAPENVESGVIAKPSARRRLRDDLWTYWRGSDAVPEFPLTRSDVWTITDNRGLCRMSACLSMPMGVCVADR